MLLGLEETLLSNSSTWLWRVVSLYYTCVKWNTSQSKCKKHCLFLYLHFLCCSNHFWLVIVWNHHHLMTNLIILHADLFRENLWQRNWKKSTVLKLLHSLNYCGSYTDDLTWSDHQISRYNSFTLWLFIPTESSVMLKLIIYLIN